MAQYDDLPERPLDPPESKAKVCDECNKEVPYFEDVKYCYEHIDDVEMLAEYTEGKVDCLKKVVRENRELDKIVDKYRNEMILGDKKILDLNNVILYLTTAIQENIDKTTELNIRTGEALAKLREKGAI